MNHSRSLALKPVLARTANGSEREQGTLVERSGERHDSPDVFTVLQSSCQASERKTGSSVST